MKKGLILTISIVFALNLFDILPNSDKLSFVFL